MVLGVALELIKNQENGDGTGKKYYCRMMEDEDGFPLPPVVFSDKLSELHESESIHKSDIMVLEEDIDKKMSDEYLHISARETLAKLVVEVSSAVLQERKNNTNDAVYKMYMDVCRGICKELRS